MQVPNSRWARRYSPASQGRKPKMDAKRGPDADWQERSESGRGLPHGKTWRKFAAPLVAFAARRESNWQSSGRRLLLAGRMKLFALTIFTGAFLLFQVQPLIAKFILPWFGGTPAVWTTCMLFFQTCLLAAYAYAHLTVRYLTPRKQALLHTALLLAALAFLPIVPHAHWKPGPADEPIGGDPAAADGLPGSAVFRAGSDKPAVAGLVQPVASRRHTVSAICAVEHRVAAGAGELSVCGRAGVEAANAGQHVGLGFWGVCPAVRRVRVAVVAEPHGLDERRSGGRPPQASPLPLAGREDGRWAGLGGGRETLSPRAPVHSAEQNPVVWPAAVRVGAAVGHHQQAVPGGRCCPVSMGPAAEPLSAHVYHLL